MSRKGRLILAAAAFCILFLVKILVSGLLLQEFAVSLPGHELARAEESTPPQELKEQTLRLQQKEEKLRAWEEELKKREEQIQPLQEEIDRKMAELEEIQANLTVFAKKLAEREKALKDTKVEHLVSLYQAMEPERAAAIMSNLEVATVVRILGNMRGKSAGLILAAMPPERGAAISEQLSRSE